jgi:endogenous inhibitor of DNA gyrase (YacG/DUF329 family)
MPRGWQKSPTGTFTTGRSRKARYGSRVRIECPICKAVLPDAADDHPTRPFCSARCKLADLHNWMTEEYKVSEPLELEPLAHDEHKPN